ncbi:MAG: hypothetical protein PHD83_06550, partial [Caldisericia bacterium]|nr:hypothetical protein [Caldisericia bacterium]
MTFVGDFDIVKQSESHRSKEVSEMGCHADNQPESETFIGFLAFCLMLALASMIIFVLSALLLLLFPSVLDIPQTIFTRNTAFYSWIFFSQIMLVMRADDDRNNYWDFNSYADKSLVLI